MKRLVFAPIFFWGKTGGGCWSLTGGDWANTRHKWTTTFWSYPTHRVFHGKESVQHTCRGVGTWRLQLQPFGWSTFFWTWGRENTLPGSSDATVFFLVLFGSCNQGTTPLRSWSLVQRRNFCSPNVMFQPLYFLRTHVLTFPGIMNQDPEWWIVFFRCMYFPTFLKLLWDKVILVDFENPIPLGFWALLVWTDRQLSVSLHAAKELEKVYIYLMCLISIM